MQLYNFYGAAYKQHAEATKILIETVGGKELDTTPFETNFALHFSNKFISQSTYEALGGIDGLIVSKKMGIISDKLQEIKDSCFFESVPISINAICQECGQKHEKIEISQDVVCYARILYDHREIHKYIGFCFYEEYQNDISQALLSIIVNLPEGINYIKNIKCVILVEGQTEEIAIPALAVKYGKPLATKRIHVMNSQSKQKVLSDFKKLRDNFPELKICAIVDSDAKKEKMEFEKANAGQRNKFSFKYISKGTFEDLIPLHIALDALNLLYPIQNPITANDINNKKEFIHQIDKILWDRSNSKLDKIKFIKEAVRLMQGNDIPDLIKELIDDAYNLAELR